MEMDTMGFASAMQPACWRYCLESYAMMSRWIRYRRTVEVVNWRHRLRGRPECTGDCPLHAQARGHGDGTAHEVVSLQKQVAFSMRHAILMIVIYEA